MLVIVRIRKATVMVAFCFSYLCRTLVARPRYVVTLDVVYRTLRTRALRPDSGQSVAIVPIVLISNISRDHRHGQRRGVKSVNCTT